jgi:hypothetical protein
MLVVLIAVVGLGPPALAAWAATASSARRERLWQAEAIGLALLAGLWLTALLGPGRTGS